MPKLYLQVHYTLSYWIFDSIVTAHTLIVFYIEYLLVLNKCSKLATQVGPAVLYSCKFDHIEARI